MRLVICLVFWLLSSVAPASPITSFDDIDFWVGSGINRSAVAIDWDDDSASDDSLVWGYRWDGAATGEEMLTAISSADPRLYLTTSQQGAAVFGLGYDFDDDGQLGSGDDYEEGWSAGFWHYGIATGNAWPGISWSSSIVGMTDRTLIDESWDSWAFNEPITFTAFAENPHAAAPLVTLGDYNSDGLVDEGDYGHWLSTLGKTVSPFGTGSDGSGNGIIDQADYDIWKQNFGNPAHGIASLSQQIPEPAAVWLLTIFFLFASLCRERLLYFTNHGDV